MIRRWTPDPPRHPVARGQSDVQQRHDDKNCGSPALENHSSMRHLLRFKAPYPCGPCATRAVSRKAEAVGRNITRAAPANSEQAI